MSSNSYPPSPPPPPNVPPPPPPYGTPPPPGGYQPPPPGYPQGYPPPPYAYKPPTCGLAIASMVVGIVGVWTMFLGVILGPIALVLASKARKVIRTGEQGGEGFATAGKVTGIIGIILGAVVIIIYVLMIAVFFRFMTHFPSGRFDEENTRRNMESVADALDAYRKENNTLPEDTRIYSGNFSNEILWTELEDTRSLLLRSNLRDGWERPLVYDRLKGTGDELEVNEAFSYDRSILEQAASGRPPRYIIWSKGAEEKDPGDDIFFIEGRGIVRPPGYEGTD